MLAGCSSVVVVVDGPSFNHSEERRIESETGGLVDESFLGAKKVGVARLLSRRRTVEVSESFFSADTMLGAQKDSDCWLLAALGANRDR